MVTELATTENSYQEAFQTLQAGQQDTARSWLVRLRENAMARFAELGFPNGRLRNDLSRLTGLPEGVATLDLSDAIADERYAEIVHTHLARHADYVGNSFAALNTAFVGHGAFVYIPKGISITAPLHLLLISDLGQSGQVTFPRVLVVAEENSSATLVESYVSVTGAAYFTNSVVEIVLKEGARLEHYKVQRENAAAFHIASTAAD